MSCTPLAGAEEDVFDLTEVVPETERLDSSLQKAKAQLSIRTRRQRPSRSRLRDSVSSIDGDESCGPVPELLLSSPSSRRSRAFTFDPCPLAVDREEQEERRSYKHLLSVSSPESAPRVPSRPASHSETSSPVHVRSGEGSRPLLQRGENSQSEDDGPEEPDSPTVLLDKKTRRRFLDLGVTLRRTYGKVRRDKSSRLSGGHGTENRSSRSSGPPFVPFSWFSERLRGPGSPKNSQSRAFPTGSGEDGESSVALLDDCITTHQSSRPHHTHTHKEQDGGHDTDFGFRKKMLSAAGKERPERQNGVHGKRDGEEGQQLLST